MQSNFMIIQIQYDENYNEYQLTRPSVYVIYPSFVKIDSQKFQYKGYGKVGAGLMSHNRDFYRMTSPKELNTSKNKALISSKES